MLKKGKDKDIQLLKEVVIGKRPYFSGMFSDKLLDVCIGVLLKKIDEYERILSDDDTEVDGHKCKGTWYDDDNEGRDA